MAQCEPLYNSIACHCLCPPRLLLHFESEALVELTPLSVAPATRMYTPNAGEIKPSKQRDEVAFVRAHIKQTDHVHEALASFKHILRSRANKAKDDGDGSASSDQEDYEIVLGIKGSRLNADETMKLVPSIIHEGTDIEKSLTERVRSTSLSFQPRLPQPIISPRNAE